MCLALAAGTLVALERPADYQERRSDGYQEPQLIFLVGTAHVSPQSAADVRQVVQAVQPDSVVVELCRSRQAVMYPAAAAGTHGQGQTGDDTSSGGAAAALQSVGAGSESEGEEDGQAASSAQNGSSSSQYGSADNSGSSGSARAVNNFSLSGGGLLPAFSRSMELGGASALLLRLLLSRLSARLAGSLGVQGGGEFVAAREEAEALGAQVGPLVPVVCLAGCITKSGQTVGSARAGTAGARSRTCLSPAFKLHRV